MRTAGWEDVSSYSRGEERVPSAWILRIGFLRLTLTKRHVLYPDDWTVICEPLIYRSSLGGSDETSEADAKKMAVELLENVLSSHLTEVIAFNASNSQSPIEEPQRRDTDGAEQRQDA
jgi:hypothetical protein